VEITMKGFRLFAVVVLAALTLLAIKETVLASGSEGTNGSYIDGTVKWYNNNPRTVTYPPSPGPEVAFYLDTSSASGILMLGTSYCGATYDGPIYTQYYHSWQPVAYFSSGRAFCVVTYGNGGSGSFSGTIAWD
jgi:hypothetical protein